MALKTQTRLWLLLVCVLLSACAVNQYPQTPESQPRVASAIKAQTANLADDSAIHLPVRGMTLNQAVKAFYQRRHYEPVWTEADMLSQLVATLEDLRYDGLNPDEYSLAALRQAQQELPNLTSVTKQAQLDILATQACMTGLAHLFIGKLDPNRLEPQWNYTSQALDPEVGFAALEQALGKRDIAQLFAQARPRQKIYFNLREGLRQLYSVQDRGGWPIIPYGPSLKPGTVNPRVPLLRQRLIAAGLLAPELAYGQTYDNNVAKAVNQFQIEQNLDVDGAVGAETLAMLNVPLPQRINQVKANLERGRWLLHEINGTFLLVDIAGYNVHLFKEGKAIWRSRIQVGNPYRSTPIFKSRLTYVTFNPTWTIPPTIFKEDILPRVQQNRGYLAAHRLRVINHQGKELNPATINWNNPGNILLREDAGPYNPLGQMVIRFPNAHAIYMHDTPSRTNFGKGQRAFSSGCIRLEHPLELVELLLDDPVHWNRQALEDTLATGETRDVGFPVKIPIMLAYFTVGVSHDGRLNYRQDIYDRDPTLIAALQKVAN